MKRCSADAKKHLSTKMDELNTVAERLSKYPEDTNQLDSKDVNAFLKDNADLNLLQKEVEKRKVFLYATNAAAQSASGRKEIAAEVQAMNNNLHPLAQRGMAEESDLARTGQYLNKMQGRAESYEKSLGQRENDTQLRVARTMYNRGFKSVKEALEQKLLDDRDEAIGNILERNGSDDATNETSEVEQTYYRNKELLDDAYEYARRDARDVLDKDIKANSGSYFSPMQGMNTSYKKNVDGSFTVSTSFPVPATDYGNAVEQIEESFNLEDIQITTSPASDKNGWTAKTTYVFNGGESLEDAKKFHEKTAFAGTPLQRAVREDIARVDSLPPIR
jgi:hypothetical protein